MGLKNLLYSGKRLAMAIGLSGAIGLTASPALGQNNSTVLHFPTQTQEYVGIPLTGDITPYDQDLDFKLLVDNESDEMQVLYVHETVNSSNQDLIKIVENKVEQAMAEGSDVRVTGKYLPRGNGYEESLDEYVKEGKLFMNSIGFYDEWNNFEDLYFTDPSSSRFYIGDDDFIIVDIFGPGHRIGKVHYPHNYFPWRNYPSWDIDGDGIPNYYDPNPYVPNLREWEDWNHNGIPDWYDPFYSSNYFYWHFWDWNHHSDAWADWYDVGHYNHHITPRAYYNIIHHGRDGININDPRWHLRQEERDGQRNLWNRSMVNPEGRPKIVGEDRENIRRNLIGQERLRNMPSLEERIKRYDDGPRIRPSDGNERLRREGQNNAPERNIIRPESPQRPANPPANRDYNRQREGYQRDSQPTPSENQRRIQDDRKRKEAQDNQNQQRQAQQRQLEQERQRNEQQRKQIEERKRQEEQKQQQIKQEEQQRQERQRQEQQRQEQQKQKERKRQEDKKKEAAKPSKPNPGTRKR